SLYLAAGGQRYASARQDQNLMHQQADPVLNRLPDRGAQVLGSAAANFDTDHDGVAPTAEDAERDDAVGAQVARLRYRPLDVLRVIVDTVGDHDVLEASAQMKVAANQVTEVSGIEPAAPVHLGGGVGPLEVALGDA